jgi:hypothetical protein
MSPDGKSYSQTDRILIDRRRHSSLEVVRYSRAEAFDSDHSELFYFHCSSVSAAW